MRIPIIAFALLALSACGESLDEREARLDAQEAEIRWQTERVLDLDGTQRQYDSTRNAEIVSLKEQLRQSDSIAGAYYQRWARCSGDSIRFFIVGHKDTLKIWGKR